MKHHTLNSFLLTVCQYLISLLSVHPIIWVFKTCFNLEGWGLCNLHELFCMMGMRPSQLYTFQPDSLELRGAYGNVSENQTSRSSWLISRTVVTDGLHPCSTCRVQIGIPLIMLLDKLMQTSMALSKSCVTMCGHQLHGLMGVMLTCG